MKDSDRCYSLVKALILFFAAVALAAIFVLALLYTKPASAATLRGNELSCMALSNLAVDVSEMRDAQVPWQAFYDWLHPQLVYAMKNPESYVQSKADADFVVSALKRVYDDPTLDQVKAHAATFNACMTEKSSYKRIVL